MLVLIFNMGSILFANVKKAQNTLDSGKNANSWYFLTGAGVGGSRHFSDINQNVSSIGFHLSTAVGYYLQNLYAFEIGSITSFNEFRNVELDGMEIIEEEADLLAWHTIFNFGIRAQIPIFKPTNYINPFLKIFYGYGMSVAYFKDVSGINTGLLKYRMHQEGPIFGFSVSNIFNLFNNNKQVWFIEFTSVYQIFRESYAVSYVGGVSEIHRSAPTQNNNYFIHGSFSIGIRLF